MCPNCGVSHNDFDEAVNEHCACMTWSCRYLHDFHSIYPRRKTENLRCSLCHCSLRNLIFNCEENGLKHHAAKFHKFRDCAQEVFTTEAEFIEHLIAEHAARRECLESAELHAPDEDTDLMDLLRKLGAIQEPSCLEPWESLQYVERLDGVPLIRSVLLFEKPYCCESRQPRHVVSVLEGTDIVNDQAGLENVVGRLVVSQVQLAKAAREGASS